MRGDGVGTGLGGFMEDVMGCAALDFRGEGGL